MEVTNNACERALRRAVVQRKITNGYRAMWTAEGEAAIRRRDWKLTMPLRGPEKGQGWRSRFPSRFRSLKEPALERRNGAALHWPPMTRLLAHRRQPYNQLPNRARSGSQTIASQRPALRP